MNHEIIKGIIVLIGLGAGDQRLAWYRRIPSILVLLTRVLIAGPVTGWFRPEEVLGQVTFPFISLAAGVVLFEGGLYDRLDFVRGVDTFVTTLSGASMVAMRRGFRDAGIDANDVVGIYGGLMDLHSLLLTPNTESIYFGTWLDLSDGAVIVESRRTRSASSSRATLPERSRRSSGATRSDGPPGAWVCSLRSGARKGTRSRRSSACAGL